MTRGGANLAIASLGRIMQTIRRLSEAPKRVAQIAAPKITDMLQQQFDQGKDPYGRAWNPLRPSTLAKGRRPPPLTDKRNLRKGTKAVASRYGIRLMVGPKGFFHQVGFRVGRTFVAPRRILPQYGLPKEWKVALDNAARQAGREARR